MFRRFRKFLRIKAFQFYWFFSGNKTWHFCEYSIGTDTSLIPAEIDSSLKFIRHLYYVSDSKEPKVLVESFLPIYTLHSIDGVIL